MVIDRGPQTSGTAEAKELRFRYHSLLAAQRILDDQGRHPAGEVGLKRERLRRLYLYIRDSLAAVERRMEQLGLAPVGSRAIDHDRG